MTQDKYINMADSLVRAYAKPIGEACQTWAITWEGRKFCGHSPQSLIPNLAEYIEEVFETRPAHYLD